MQDKEFDQLFKDKFQDAEIAPSANLWANIAEELEPRKKRVLPVYWMAAAVAVIAISAGLLMPETDTIKLKGTDVAVERPVADTKISVSPEAIANDESNKDASTTTPLVIAPRLTAADVKKDFAALQPKNSNVHPVNIAPEIAKPVVSQIVQEEPVIPETDVVIASVAVPEETNVITETEPNERKGIRNVGDIVNYVVERVDKREKKFLKFNTDDDDNSSLVAINIGILKFNKRSDK